MTAAPLSRRDFLRISGALTAAAAFGCSGGGGGSGQSAVAVGRAHSYDRSLVRQELEAMFEQLGGLGPIVRHGRSAVIKVNLTGGSGARPLTGIPAIESYLTHPALVYALSELLRDSGVIDITVVEAVDDPLCWAVHGYSDLAGPLGVRLIDLNGPGPYPDYTSISSSSPLVFESFTVNRVLTEADVFVSVAKMKCHSACGITHSMKNLVGLVPWHRYSLTGNDGVRSALHGPAGEEPVRLPGAVIDLNTARPVDLALVDGIWTVQGGEGPWLSSISPIRPGVMLAGADPVAVDAVATALMGFDPEADSPQPPFSRCVNHLNLAAARDLGTNRLAEIAVLGAALPDVQTPFVPA